jgi:hypothetical protein
MARYNNRSIGDAFWNMNLGVTLAMMVFAIAGLVQTGLMMDIVEFMTTYKFLPLAASFGAYVVAFAVSGTRDPRYYHPVEYGVVMLTGGVMVAHTGLTEVQDFVASYDPWASIGVMTLMVVTGAILAR